MPSAAYTRWINAGEPYTLMRPAKALQRNLKRRGLTVYDYPDDSHLEADPPQDHTPFSSTGYPRASAFGVGHAIDIMRRGGSSSYAARKENADIARRLIADRDAGHPGVAWIKYINWTDENGVCRQERWIGGRSTRSSNDKGHIHVSGYSDMDSYGGAETYDPLEVSGMTREEEIEVIEAARLTKWNIHGWLKLLIDAQAADDTDERARDAADRQRDEQISATLASMAVAGLTDERIEAFAGRVAEALEDGDMGPDEYRIIVREELLGLTLKPSREEN